MTKIPLLIVLVLQSLMLHAAVSQQCFNSPKDAYDYLMHLEKINQQQALVGSGLPVNINTASEAVLTTLKGIGSHKAKAIIKYRQTNGRFKQIDDLTEVKGIGDKTVAKNRSRLSVSD